METLENVKRSLRAISKQCLSRGLSASSRWALELLTSAASSPSSDAPRLAVCAPDNEADVLEVDDEADDVYDFARSLFEDKQFLRAAHMLERDSPHRLDAAASSNLSRRIDTDRRTFLRLYSLFLDGERRRETERAQGGDSLARVKAPVNPNLSMILAELNTVLESDKRFSASQPANASDKTLQWRNSDPAAHAVLSRQLPRPQQLAMAHNISIQQQVFTMSAAASAASTSHFSTTCKPNLSSNLHRVDAFLLWLRGVVLRELERRDEARTALLAAARAQPLLWSAWSDLASVSSSRAELDALDLPAHWAAHVFRAHALLELQASSPASLQALQPVSSAFPRSPFLKAMAARALYNLRRFDQAQLLLEALRRDDPHRLEDVDTLSNILYVRGEAAQLSALAQEVFALDRYSPQACCVVGNFFSARREHERAVLSFRRALRLDPLFLGAWTLMGHEYVELKNTAAAVECYRRAVDANARDYRAWYGLGQTYEILQMFLYAAHYYRRACALRPHDARMWCALGSCYESLERRGDAVACLERAALYSDKSSVAALRLARLYREDGSVAAACKWYALYAEEGEGAESGAGPRNARDVEGREGVGGGEVAEALLFLATAAQDEGRLLDAETFVLRVLAISVLAPNLRQDARALLDKVRCEQRDAQFESAHQDKAQRRNRERSGALARSEFAGPPTSNSPALPLPRSLASAPVSIATGYPQTGPAGAWPALGRGAPWGAVVSEVTASNVWERSGSIQPLSAADAHLRHTEVAPGVAEPSPALLRGVSFSRGSIPRRAARSGARAGAPSGASAGRGDRDERLHDDVDDDGEFGEMTGLGLASAVAGEAPDSSLTSASLDFLASPLIALSFGSRSGEGGAVEGGFVESAFPDASGEGMEVDRSRD